MPNPTASSESFAKMGDHIERIGEDVRNRANRIAGDVSDRASEYYRDASSWLQQNYGRTLTVVGVLAAAGLVGWMLSRGFGNSQMNPRGTSEH